MHLAAQMEAMKANPDSPEHAKSTTEQMEAMMGDPSVKRFTEQVSAMMTSPNFQRQVERLTEQMEPQGNPVPDMEDNLADNLIDKLVGRALSASRIQDADSTTLGKAGTLALPRARTWAQTQGYRHPAVAQGLRQMMP